MLLFSLDDLNRNRSPIFKLFDYHSFLPQSSTVGDISILPWKPEVAVDFSRMYEASEHHTNKEDRRFKSFQRESPTFLMCVTGNSEVG